MNGVIFFYLIILLWIGDLSEEHKKKDKVYIRHNLVGYLDNDFKSALAFSNSKVKGNFEIVNAISGETVFTGKPGKSTKKERWGKFSNYYTLDFSPVKAEGKYLIRLTDTGDSSRVFNIGKSVYNDLYKDLLVFMRQQRCGYNPYLDRVCHQKDGRTFYGPMPDSTFIDVSGGWHDAGDQLKYLITSSFATAFILTTYDDYRNLNTDSVTDLGNGYSNDIPDLLDEAKWGLDWIHKMHPEPTMLFHQVADDRDHTGWKWPDEDRSDYGWGQNSYRPVYFANGLPQGLREYKSEATGFANLAGRSAAAMARASHIWRSVLKDTVYANKCLKTAIELYELGKENEGYQQGNSYGAPYRYNEETWADDMEWGAAELFRTTENIRYLNEAKKYARMASTESWLEKDSASHYQYYPFINPGHYVLYPFVDQEFKEQLAGFYRSGIENTLRRANQNVYEIGVPFIWCSNNLVTALITQILFYEQMTGDFQYHDFMLLQRDWLFGRNPWGTSMFTGIPAGGEYPEDVHTSVWFLTKKEVPGGLVDGPVYNSIYNSLRGLTLTQPDEFADFQNDFVVYHDDIGDYSTNEPTMDGTASAFYLAAYLSSKGNNPD